MDDRHAFLSEIRELQRSPKSLAERNTDAELLLGRIEHALAQRVLVGSKDLAGTAEMADLFSVSRTVVSGWHDPKRMTVPPGPVTRLSSGPVFDSWEYMRWHNAWVPVKGNKVGSVPDQLRGLL
jgi:hypothetical protein